MQDPASFDNHDWNPPLSMEGVPLQPWPQEVFPEPFQYFITELSRSTETPIELSAMITLAVVAAATQKKYLVRVKADYCEPVNLWALGILPPASRKSKVYSEVTSPLMEWEREQRELLEPQIQAINSKRKTIDVRLKELRSKASKASESDYRSIQKDIERLEQEMPEAQAIPQLWTSDVTPEHLGTIMAVNEDAMAVLSDEGGIFDILGGIYSDGKANIDLFLQSHAASPVRVDRGSRPPVFLERAVLTMGLTVQPQVIKSICGNKTFKGRGLLGRFLYVIPKSNIGKRTLNEPPISQEAVSLYRDAVRAIIANPKRGDGTINELTLSPEAYERWLEYAKALEMMMGEDLGTLSHITDWAGKLAGAIARIAALLHIMRYAHGRPWEKQISPEDMSAAVKIGHALTSHALTVFDHIEEDRTTQVAKAILQWLKQQKPPRFSRRDCTRKLRSFKKEERNAGLEMLKEHEILRGWELKPEIGRPSDMFEVNPHFYK